MAYQANIPQATDRLKDSQADLLGNFQELNTYLNVNHTAIDGTADQGKHKFVTLPFQTVVPPALPNELNIVSLLDVTGSNNLFMTTNSGSALQITGGAVNFTPPTTINGWVPLVPGFYMKWFTHTQPVLSPGISSGVFTFPIAPNIPVFSTGCVLVWLTKLGNNSTSIDYDVYWDASTTNATQVGARLINNTGGNINNASFVIMGMGV